MFSIVWILNAIVNYDECFNYYTKVDIRKLLVYLRVFTYENWYKNILTLIEKRHGKKHSSETFIFEVNITSNLMNCVINEPFFYLLKLKAKFLRK